ncbi:hypothetical protein FJY90_03865 [Candidatus Gottesmanbacteria bacterium]|nr:hypothetical protein [Candidatus Gottesmanbacteria bacterium]
MISINNLAVFILIISSILLSSAPVMAITDPSSVPNNKYGIHIIDENDLEKAAALVNSSGGDWGWVTVVISQNDRNISKWNNIFYKMKQLHLIPIIRLATIMEGNSWKKPEVSDAFSWTDFLSHLDWVVKNRYVIIFNEPNHAKEWGNSINPQEYSQILVAFSKTLKSSSSDFFILPAGFDASAPNSKDTMDESDFIQAMFQAKTDILSYIDGWTSHSYPNPGFTGNVNAEGKGTLKTYQWELNLLETLGNKKQFPVFISETGWPHQEGTFFNRNFFSADKVAELIIETANSVWNDSKIIAITPFVLNYQSYPFSNFSWQKFSQDNFYPQYQAYQLIPKTAGQPVKGIDLKIYLANLNLNFRKSNDNESNFLNYFPLKISDIFSILRNFI